MCAFDGFHAADGLLCHVGEHSASVGGRLDIDIDLALTSLVVVYGYPNVDGLVARRKAIGIAL